MPLGDKDKSTTENEVQPYSDEVVVEFLRERKERIEQRRARIGDRIARRNEALREGSVASSNELPLTAADDTRSRSGLPQGSSGPDSIPGKGKAKDGSSSKKTGGGGDSLDIQIDESRKQLEQIILDGETLITNVRIAAECREKVRHIKQTESRKDRLERLRHEAEECQSMYEDLKPNWDLKSEKKLPMDLFDGVKAQMQSCEELLMKKQDLIQSLQQELEENDYEYEQSLEMYQKDVSLIGDRIDDSVDELQGAFLNELGLIENYTCRNREVLLEENQREWMDLLEDFETMEESNLEQRKSDALNKFQSLNELYVNVKQECRANRHKFEDDLRILIQELENIKYATQLNMEKLQYNLAIVRKRYKENVEMKNMMKRLLLKFNDRFTTKSRALKQKMETGRKEAKKILGEISKLEESLDQFGKKTLHLAVSDWHKYMDLWMVSEEIVRDKVQRLLDSEKYIFETQLGTDAPMPELTFMDERPPIVTKHLMKENSAYAEMASAPVDNAQISRINSAKSNKSNKIGDEVDHPHHGHKKHACKANASLVLLPSESLEFVPGPEPDPKIQRRLMKHVAKVICDESGFLVEEELRRLVDPLIETERNLVNLDALLKALGINSVGEMQYLAHFLLKRCRVTKGIISKIGSQASAHLSEMNVSLTGIMGKNAVDDWESSPNSTPSGTPIDGLAADSPISDEETQTQQLAPEFKECKCDDNSKSTGGKKSVGIVGEVSVDAVNQISGPTNDDDDDVDDATCAFFPEIKALEDERITYEDFNHEPLQCSPKCCSVDTLGEEETIEAVVVTLAEDNELEDVLEESSRQQESQSLNTRDKSKATSSWTNGTNEDESIYEESSEGNSEGNEEQSVGEEEVEVVVQAESKCSTCGEEPHDHQDCSFKSSQVTVFSWVDSQDPPNKTKREELKQARINIELEGSTEEKQPGIDSQATVQTTRTLDAVSSKPPLPPISSSLTVSSELHAVDTRKTAGGSEAITIGQETSSGDRTKQDETGTDEVLRTPVRVFSEIQSIEGEEVELVKADGETREEHQWQADEEDDSAGTVSVASLKSSSCGSDEFMYISPQEVIEALTEFCKEYNAKITVELPTLDELIDRKLATFKYPRTSSVMEYWERPIRMLSAKSDDLWEGMQYAFEEFNGALKKRNASVDEVLDLYRKNYELSFLMKNHVASANQRFLPTPTGPGTRMSGQYC